MELWLLTTRTGSSRPHRQNQSWTCSTFQYQTMENNATQQTETGDGNCSHHHRAQRGARTDRNRPASVAGGNIGAQIAHRTTSSTSEMGQWSGGRGSASRGTGHNG